MANLSIIVTAIDRASAELKKAQQGLEKLEKSGKASAEELEKARAAADGLASAARALAPVVGAAGLATLAIEGAQAAFELSQLATQFDRVNMGLNAYSGGRADETTEAITTALQGTISEAEAANIAMRLFGLGLVETDAEAAQLAHDAAVLGAAFKGMNAGQAADEFAMLMTNMSFLRMDQFGLSAAEARKRIDELRDANSDLTREEAFNIAVMEQMQSKAEALGGTLSDQIADTDRTKAAWQDYRLAVGGVIKELGLISHISPRVTGFLEGQTDAVKLWVAALEQGKLPTQQFIDEMERLAEVGRQAEQDFGGVRSEAARFASMMGDAAAATEDESEAVEDDAAALREYQRALDHVASVQSTTLDTTRELTADWHSQQDITNALIGDIGRLGLSKQQQADAETALLLSSGQITQAQADQARVMQDAALAYESGRISLEGLLSVYQSAPQGLDVMTTALQDAQTQSELTAMDLALNADASVQALSPLEQMYGNVELAILDAAGAPPQVTAAVSTMSGATAGPMSVMNSRFSNLSGNIGDAVTAVGNLTTAINGLPNSKTVTIRVESEGGGGAPHRQHGGPVEKGLAYVVGERGPEYFVPNESGTIFPAGQTQRIMQGGGSVSLNIQPADVVLDGRVIGQIMFPHIQEGFISSGALPSGAFGA